MHNESEIIQAITKGNQKAFRKLYELFSEKVYNASLSYAHNIQDAEEITQDVFTNIFKNIAKFKGEAALSTWIYRITVNASLNHIKREKRFAFFKLNKSESDRPDFDHPGVLLENKDNASVLFKVIYTLPESQKTAFILSYVEGLPRQEVADVMEISLKAVESLLQRAKQNLRKKLEKLYPHRRKTKS